ncbi:MAG: hypothetical protein ACI9T7_003117 [Oleiphilaceae bacterium]
MTPIGEPLIVAMARDLTKNLTHIAKRIQGKALNCFAKAILLKSVKQAAHKSGLLMN